MLRFWSGVVAGTYVGHSEIFAHSASSWLAIGGVLTGQSPPRLAFLRKMMEAAPDGEIDPIDKWQDEKTGGKAGQYYLIYFGKEAAGLLATASRSTRRGSRKATGSASRCSTPGI